MCSGEDAARRRLRLLPRMPNLLPPSADQTRARSNPCVGHFRSILFIYRLFSYSSTDRPPGGGWPWTRVIESRTESRRTHDESSNCLNSGKIPTENATELRRRFSSKRNEDISVAVEDDSKNCVYVCIEKLRKVLQLVA